MSVAKPVQLALVHLQAATAEAALGERELAHARLDPIMALSPDDLLAVATVVADYLDDLTLGIGHRWATGPDPAPGEEPLDLDARVPPARALTLRLMSAWSSRDPDSFAALLLAAARDGGDGADDIRDLFVYALDWTQSRGIAIVNPRVMAKQMCRAVDKHGPSSLSLARAPRRD